MILDMNNQEAMALLEQLKLAHESQSAIIKAISALNEGGHVDILVAEKLMQNMVNGTNKIADLQDQLQQFRLDS